MPDSKKVPTAVVAASFPTLAEGKQTPLSGSPAAAAASSAEPSSPVIVTSTPAAALAERFQPRLEREHSASSLSGAVAGEGIRERRISISTVRSNLSAVRQRQAASGLGGRTSGGFGFGTEPIPAPERRTSVTRLVLGERSQLNKEINKELRIRTGAENMLKVGPRVAT